MIGEIEAFALRLLGDAQPGVARLGIGRAPVRPG